MVSVSIQGAPGSFSELAAKEAFRPKRPNFVHCSTNAEAVQLVHQGKADHAFLATEISDIGILEAGHLAMVSSELKKGKSHWQDLQVCLAGTKGTRVDDVTQVMGHEGILAACQDFVAMHGWISNQVRDSAEAAEDIASRDSSNFAALCSKEAAALHKLDVLREGVQDRDSLRVRYVTMSPRARQAPDYVKTSAAPF